MADFILAKHSEGGGLSEDDEPPSEYELEMLTSVPGTNISDWGKRNLAIHQWFCLKPDSFTNLLYSINELSQSLKNENSS